MSRSRVALRFWTAIGVAPAVLASFSSTSCRSGGDGRSTEPATPLVVGTTAPTASLDVIPSPPGEETTARGRPLCAVDHYPGNACTHISLVDTKIRGPYDSNDCPATTSTEKFWPLFASTKSARLDQKRTAEVSGGNCCYQWCQQIQVLRTPPVGCQPGLYERNVCFDMPDRGSSAPAAAPFDRCPIGITASEIDGTHGSYPGRFDVETSNSESPSEEGQSSMPSRCCYVVCGPMQMRAIPGRPAHDDDGGLAIAKAMRGGAWRLSSPLGVSRSDISLADALLEHASIAAFARLSLSLLAFGAPPDLVADAHRAALDEIRHAQISFTLAGGDATIGPSPCPAFAELRAHRSLAELAEETYVDGCIGETVASLRLRAMANGDETILSMAQDEERHAELAWRIVEWAIAIGDASVRERIASARANGGGDELATWAQANVIQPCTDALLSETA